MPAWSISIRSAPRPAKPNWRAAAALGCRPGRRRCWLRWGYPYVFATWFFHMTLTRRLTAAEKARLQPQAEAHFARALSVPRRVGDICLFTQAAPDAGFVIAERLKLRG